MRSLSHIFERAQIRRTNENGDSLARGRNPGLYIRECWSFFRYLGFAGHFDPWLIDLKSGILPMLVSLGSTGGGLPLFCGRPLHPNLIMGLGIGSNEHVGFPLIMHAFSLQWSHRQVQLSRFSDPYPRTRSHIFIVVELDMDASIATLKHSDASLG
jgi:hypothetical protein